MPYWQILLIGPRASSVDAAHLCRLSSLHIEGTISGYYLRSPEFETMDKPEDVYALAQQRIAQINGITGILLPAFQPIELAPSVIRMFDDGKKKVWIFKREHERPPEFRLEPSTAAKTVSSTLVEEWLATARNSGPLTDALRLFALQRDEWAALYKILELARANLSPGIEERGWASGAELRRFTHTANSAEAIGDDARHSRGQFKAPSRAITLAEGLELITRILRNWIENAATATTKPSVP
jgi:hypothetical protein